MTMKCSHCGGSLWSSDWPMREITEEERPKIYRHVVEIRAAYRNLGDILREQGAIE